MSFGHKYNKMQTIELPSNSFSKINALFTHIIVRQLIQLSIHCDTGHIIIHKYKRKADARSGAALIVRSRSDATATSTPSDNEERLCSRTRSRRVALLLASPRLAAFALALPPKQHETLRQIREAEIYTRARSNMLRTCVTIQH